jgi:hypothetical protein
MRTPHPVYDMPVVQFICPYNFIKTYDECLKNRSERCDRCYEVIRDKIMEDYLTTTCKKYGVEVEGKNV